MVFFHLQSENKVIIHVNNEQSKNCLNNRGLKVFAVEVAPKSMMVRFFYCLAYSRKKSGNIFIFYFCRAFIMIVSVETVVSSDQNRSDALFGISHLILHLMHPCFPVQFDIKIHNPNFHT